MRHPARAIRDKMFRYAMAACGLLPALARPDWIDSS